MNSRLVKVPNSTLLILDHKDSWILFCTSSLALCEIPVKSMREAIRYVSEEVRPIWPRVDLKPQNSGSNEIFISILLTQECNLSCQYCYIHGNYAEWPHQIQHHNNTLSITRIQDEICKIISTMPSKINLSFFGGEPLLMLEEIVNISEYVKKIGKRHKVPVDIGITTNGSFLTQAFLQWAESEHVEIMLSLDSPPYLHNRYRAKEKLESSFYEILKRIQGYEEKLTAVTTITSKTNSITNALESLLRIGFKEVSFNLVHTRDPELSIGLNDVRRFLLEFIYDESWFAQNSKKIGNLCRIHTYIKNRNPKFRPCSAGINSCAIGPDCKRYFCHSCVGNQKFELDNFNRPLSRHLQLALERDVSRSECKRCWARHLCGGDCWLIQWEYSSYERKSRCEMIRGLVELALMTYEY